MTQQIDTSSRSEQRKFGLLMAAAITVLALIRWWHKGALPTAFLAVAAAFLVLGLLAPVLLRPIFVLWMRFSLVLNAVMTRVFLTLAYFLMIVPMALGARVLRKDLLNRAWDPGGTTYWEDPDDQPDEIDSYLNQF